MRIVSWNVNGFRALTRRFDLCELFDSWNADVVCFQETKLSHPSDIQDLEHAIFPNHMLSFWSISSTRRGYSGLDMNSHLIMIFL